MELKGIHALAFYTSDLDETVRFWTNVFGAKLVRAAREEGEPGSRHYYFEVGGSLILFYEFPATDKDSLQFGWMHHLELRAASVEDLDAWRERIAACEVPVSEVRENDLYKFIVLHEINGILVKIVAPIRTFAVSDLRLDPKPVPALRELL